VRVRRLAASDVSLVAAIERSEDVDVEYEVVAGRLVERPVTVAAIPPWDPVGTGHHTVAEAVAFVAAHLAEGATLLGAFADDAARDDGPGGGVPVGEVLAGLAVVQPRLDADRAQLAFLHVSRPLRRRGAATALWLAAVDLARAGGATVLYVSATPTGSAVGFYLHQGCVLADPVHPTLYANEPDDVHLVLRLG